MYPYWVAQNSRKFLSEQNLVPLQPSEVEKLEYLSVGDEREWARRAMTYHLFVRSTAPEGQAPGGGDHQRVR